MLSEFFGITLLLLLGILFDQLVLVLIRAKKEAGITILLLSFMNNTMIFLVLVVVYFIDGMTVRGEWGEGWLNWVTLIEGFLAAYLPVSLSFVWRVETSTL
ncbi:MAG: hypothetical protein DDT21_02310 [Syntrophomonadaceae bacterium]|nr:hypothetical protein [Bacillota bacterium]